MRRVKSYFEIIFHCETAAFGRRLSARLAERMDRLVDLSKRFVPASVEIIAAYETRPTF
jgi:hypothetical protein